MCEELTGASVEDAAAIARLLGQLLGRAPHTMEVEARLQALCQQTNVMLLCHREGGGINGFVMGLVCPHICPELSPFFLVESLVVDEQQRRRGIAGALMRAAEAWAAARDCRYITLASQKARTGAHRLYTSLGYSQDCAFQKFL